MAFDETFVSSDRAFVIAFVFGSLANLEQVDSIAAQFFFYAAWADVLRLFTGFETTEALLDSGKRNAATAKTRSTRIAIFMGVAG